MYSDLDKRNPFFQGDILQDTPFFVIPKGFDKSKRATIQNLDVVILTQTCDIERRDFVIIGRVVRLQELVETGVSQNLIESLCKRSPTRPKYLFYLPPDRSFEESYIDFTQITYTPKNILKKRNRVKSLSDLGRHWLAYQLSDYFGRPFDPTQ